MELAPSLPHSPAQKESWQLPDVKKWARHFTVGMSLVLGMGSTIATEAKAEPPKTEHKKPTEKIPPLAVEEVEMLIDQLGDNDFFKREEASETLLKRCTDIPSLLALSQGMTNPDAEIRNRSRDIVQKGKELFLKAYPAPKSDALHLDVNFFLWGSNFPLPEIFPGAQAMHTQNKLRQYYVDLANDGSGIPNFRGAGKKFEEDMHGYNISQGLKDPERASKYPQWKKQNPGKSKQDFLLEIFAYKMEQGDKLTRATVIAMHADAARIRAKGGYYRFGGMFGR